MTMDQVATNLRNTIAGKEAMLAKYSGIDNVGYEVIKAMLAINIDELQRILADVEDCLES